MRDAENKREYFDCHLSKLCITTPLPTNPRFEALVSFQTAGGELLFHSSTQYNLLLSLLNLLDDLSLTIILEASSRDLVQA